MNNQENSSSVGVQRATKRRRDSISHESVHEVVVKKHNDDETDALWNGTGSHSMIVSGGYDERPTVTSQTLNGGCHQETIIADLKRKRKLVLHFDVRNTILVSDSVTKDNVEQALNAFLASVTWGRQRRSAGEDAKTNTSQCVHEASVDDGDETCGDWVWCSERPSLSAPCPGSVTYYKGLEGRLVHSIPDRLLLRRATGNFTQQPIGRRFRPFFDEHLKLLEWNSPTASRAKEMTNDTVSNTLKAKLCISGSDGRTYHYLMPSFVKMLYDLTAADRSFAVLLRTYGVDAHNVLACASHIVAGRHPMFPRCLPIDVRPNPGSIQRFSDGRIMCKLPWNAPVSPAGETKSSPSSATIVETDADIYKMLSNCDGINGIVDDFEYWQKNEYDHLAGKPIWIDPYDDHVQHIFFDDNIRATDRDSIVDVRLFDDNDGDVISGGLDRPRSCRSLALDEISSLENACLVQADLLECISDVNYFKKKIHECETNYETWLMQRKRVLS